MLPQKFKSKAPSLHLQCAMRERGLLSSVLGVYVCVRGVLLDKLAPRLDVITH